MPLLKHFSVVHPRSLLSRLLVLLFLVLVVFQLILGGIFYNTHWLRLHRHLLETLGNEIAIIVQTPSVAQQIALAQRFGLPAQHVATDIVPATTEIPRVAKQVLRHLRRDLGIDNLVLDATSVAPHLLLYVPLASGDYLRIHIPKGRYFLTSPLLLLLLALGLTLLLLLILYQVLRWQFRPLRTLIRHAQRVGTGSVVPDIPLRGALDVRMLIRSFNSMKTRLERQIQQRLHTFSSISHGLHAPLVRMQLHLSLMPKNEDTHVLDSDIRHATRMLEGYLSFVRDEAQEEISSAVLLASYLDICVRRYDEGQGRIVLMPVDPMVRLSLKPFAFYRCLQALFDNGLVYGTRLFLSVSLDADKVKLFVDDDGIGIPDDRRLDVFKPFYRLSPATHDGKGDETNGLGLTMAQDIMYAHGGQIAIDSSPYGGTRVQLTLPR